MHRLRPHVIVWAGQLTVLALLAALVVIPGTRAQAPAPPAQTAKLDPAALDKKILEEAKTRSEIITNLTYLSDIIGPRLTGSPALKQANEWAAAKMMSYGLTNVRLEGWTIPVGWERGTATARLVEPTNGRPLLLASMGWSPGTKGKAEGDVVILNARSGKELAPYKGKLKDAIILRGTPSTIRPLSETFAQSGQTGPRGPGVQGRRREGAPGGSPEGAPGAAPGGAPGAAPGGAPGAAPGGAAGGPPMGFNFRGGPGFGEFRRELAEFLRTEGAAVVLSDAGKPQSLLVTTGGWRGVDRSSAAEPVPSAFMAHEHYALLHRLASRPAPARTRVEIEIQNKLIPGPIAVYNTVGEIRGSEKPDEFVVVGAHLDSWDLGQGTTDNGTGSTIVLEAARLLAKCGVQPKRTIRFVLFTGEEQGLHGSAEYVKQHKDEMPKTSMALVHDTGTGKVTGIGLQGREVLKSILEHELASLKEVGVSDFNTRGMGGSDHMSFEREGVPGFAVQQDMREYFLTHHTQSDTLDKAKEAELIQGAQVMAVAAMRVANLPNLLPRDKPPARERKGADTPEPKKEVAVPKKDGDK